MLIVDMVLESPGFSVKAEGRTGVGVKVDGPEIIKQVAGAAVGAKAEKTAQHEMTFQGDVEKPAVFGFTALRLDTAGSGILTTLALGPPEIVLRSMVAGRALRYASEIGGLEPHDIFPLGTDEVHLEDGIVAAVGIPEGPMVVNALPADLSGESGLLVPDDYPGLPEISPEEESACR